MSVFRRLYRGETNIDFIGNRRKWYMASAVLITLCVLSMVFRGFNFGVEFAGGNQFLLAVQPGTSATQLENAVHDKGIQAHVNVRGAGGDKRYVLRTPELSQDQRDKVFAALSSAGKVQQPDIERKEVSSSWGGNITQKALIGLVVFLLLVGVYIWVRFERAMALAALAALAHDLVLTAGVYSMIGFEVTPGTVIGLLTILGFSLYDTVVVFDKVDENTKGLLGSSRYTYGEAANLAVNQTLMRSINTSIIALLPVAGLLFVGAGLLGVGTLKDLALVLFVGMLTGAYSSLFLATPWLVDLKMFDQRYKLHTQRVLAKRAGGGEVVKAPAKKVAKVGASIGSDDDSDEADLDQTEEVAAAPVKARTGSTAPRAGARPAQGRRPRSGRPGGSKKR